MYKSKEEIIYENNQALKLLNEKNFLSAEEILKSTLEAFKRSDELSLLEVVTLNNLALLYQKMNSSFKSISYLSRASLFIPSSPQEYLYLIGTFTNLCVINSSIGFHKEALQYGYKALEIIDSIKSSEIKSLIHYNIACQLNIMQNYDKADQAFREAASCIQNELGSYHKLSILTLKALELYPQSTWYHSRVSSSGESNSKNSSFSINAQNKIKKIVMPSFNNLSYSQEIKNNYSTKISTISSTGRAITDKMLHIGMPYIKEMRISKRLDGSLYTTPKAIKIRLESKSNEKNTFNNIIGNSRSNPISFNFKNRLKKIKENIYFLEQKLKEFNEKSKNIMKMIEFDSEDYSSEITKATKYIQNWYRKNVMKNK